MSPPDAAAFLLKRLAATVDAEALREALRDGYESLPPAGRAGFRALLALTREVVDQVDRGDDD